jgi:hypothetical protein
MILSYQCEAKLRKTVKFTVSMTDAAFKEIEALRRKTGKTRSQVVRDAILVLKTEPRGRAMVKSIGEERAAYEAPSQAATADPEERRQRAIAAAGRFRSGIADLSLNHDRYLEDDFARAAAGAKTSGKKDGGP